MFRAPLLASVAALALIATPLSAQNAALSAQRDAVFQQMLAAPSDRTLMQQYAQLSVQMRDFEAAAATLERLIDLEPNNTAARVELAIAYFALGSYAIADYHLGAAQASGVLSPDQAARVARYQEESTERGDGTELDGRVEIGYASTLEGDEIGAFGNASLDWRVDLGGANVTMWVTEFAYTTFQPGDDSVSQRQTARLRTGPEFRVTGDAYGPRLQPFVEVEWISPDPVLSQGTTEWSAGVAYQNPINERITAYSSLALGFGTPHQSTFDPDYRFHEFDIGLTYRPSRDARIRVSAWLEEQEETSGFSPDTTTTVGARISGQYAFDPDFNTLPNRWVAGAFAEFEALEIGDQFGTNDETEEMSYGAWLRAFVLEDIYVETGLAMVSRENTNFGFTTTTEETVVSMQVGWEF